MFFHSPRLDFEIDGKNWPLRSQSRFVNAYGLRWHVQEMGGGETTIVLIHGTGASTHSWRGLMPLLAVHHRVVSFDLPGQGFSQSFDYENPTIKRMGEAVAALLKQLQIRNPVLMGHSAGAAIALQLELHHSLNPLAVISINGALYPFPGAGAAIFPMLARLLFLNPVVPHLFAAGAHGQHRVERLLRGTGSTLDAEGLALYQTLFKNTSHVRGTLSWMANWELEPLVQKMAEVKTPFLQIIGNSDETIAPENAALTESRVPHTKTVTMEGVGHLVHEEEPKLVAQTVMDFLKTSVTPAKQSARSGSASKETRI